MRKEEKTERTRERILNAAFEEFGKNGYRACTVNAICSNYGISKGLLYHNFQGKEELFLCCAKRCFSDVTDYLQSEGEVISIQTYLNMRFHYFSEHPLSARIFFEAMLQPPKELAERLREIKRPFDEMNLCIYQSTLSRIKLRPGVTEEEALRYYATIQEMFNSFFGGSSFSEKNMEETMEAHEKGLAKILDFMLYGIAEKGDEKV